MSSFMVKDATINRIITYLQKPSNVSDLEDVLDVLDLDKTGNYACKLGQAMHNMNRDAIFARYGDKPSDWYAYKVEHAWDISVLKSLACFLYQCSEGNVPEMPLYGALTALKGVIAYKIIQESPVYSAAEWD